jgi:hypothetical protein
LLPRQFGRRSLRPGVCKFDGRGTKLPQLKAQASLSKLAHSKTDVKVVAARDILMHEIASVV